MSLDDTIEKFNLLSIIYKHFPQAIIFIQTFCLGNTLYFLHHQLEIETFLLQELELQTFNMKVCQGHEGCPNSQGLMMETWLQVWQELLWRVLLDPYRLSATELRPRSAPGLRPPCRRPSQLTLVAWPACCVFNLREHIKASTHTTHEENLNASESSAGPGPGNPGDP
jgi:hypothetical protein